MKVNQSPPEMETAVVLTNGGGDLEASSNHIIAPEQSGSETNGPVGAAESGDNVNSEPDMDVIEAESGQVPNVNNNDEEEEEEEEGTVVMRAECVIITDEGDDVPEELTPRDDQQVSLTLDASPLSNPEAGKETGEALEEVMKTETLTEPERSEATEGTTEAQPAAGDEGMDGGVRSSTSAEGETNVEGQDVKTEDPASVQEQPPASALEGTTVALVPVYAEMPSSALSADIKAEGETTTAPEEAEAALKAEDPASLPGQFQEVSLTDPQDNLKTEAGPGEQEPLLLKAEASNAKAESARASSPGSAEAQSPSRGSQGGDSEQPKHKSCQCCSVM